MSRVLPPLVVLVLVVLGGACVAEYLVSSSGVPPFGYDMGWSFDPNPVIGGRTLEEIMHSLRMMWISGIAALVAHVAAIGVAGWALWRRRRAREAMGLEGLALALATLVMAVACWMCLHAPRLDV